MKYKIDRDIEVYRDIIHLPHHVSKIRTRMKLSDRAVQFAPFSAVVGHGSAVKEAARLTEIKRDLDEMEKALIDIQLREIAAKLPSGESLEIIYFKPDFLKEGGEYVSSFGKVKKIDAELGKVLMLDGTTIIIDDILKIIVE